MVPPYSANVAGILAFGRIRGNPSGRAAPALGRTAPLTPPSRFLLPCDIDSFFRARRGNRKWLMEWASGRPSIQPKWGQIDSLPPVTSAESPIHFTTLRMYMGTEPCEEGAAWIFVVLLR